MHAITEEKEIVKLEEEIGRLKQLVYYDELTGLLNRRGFKNEVENVFRVVPFILSNDHRRIDFLMPFSMIFFDIDNFKGINDNYSHDAGDEVIGTIAKKIKHRLRVKDICSRWGGDEFTALLLGADVEDTKKFAERFAKEIEDHEIIFKDAIIKTTLSIGVVGYDGRQTLTDMLAYADKAMYIAKKNGKNRVEVLEK